MSLEGYAPVITVACHRHHGPKRFTKTITIDKILFFMFAIDIHLSCGHIIRIKSDAFEVYGNQLAAELEESEEKESVRE